MWGKLGYPRRALRLHECARTVVDRFGGELPGDVETLLTLPGVGTYTARAVAAFAFGQRQPVVDTNVRRVVARAVRGRGAAMPPSASRGPRRRRGAVARRAIPRGRCVGRTDGTGRAGLHRPHAALRRVPDLRAVRLASGRITALRRAQRAQRNASPEPTARCAACSSTCCAEAITRLPETNSTSSGQNPSSAIVPWRPYSPTAWSTPSPTARYALPALTDLPIFRRQFRGPAPPSKPVQPTPARTSRGA